MKSAPSELSSVTVAIQCLETTFKISSSDCHLAVPQPLTEIFLNSLLKVGTAQNAEEGASSCSIS